MANRIRSTALIGGVAVVAVFLLIAQRGQAQTIASDRAAGYVVFPKVVVDSGDIFHQGRAVDTLIQLTNTSPDCRVVECFYVNATKHCSGININGATNGACRTNADCIGGTCGLATDWQETNFFMVLSGNQAVGWSANLGGVIPPDAGCPGEPVGPDGSVLPRGCGTGGPCGAPETFFAGEVKCVEVDGDTPTDSSGTPIGANDLKGEATIYEVAAGIPGGVDVRGYNGVGIQATSVSGLPIGKTCTGGPSQGATCATDANCGIGGSCDIAMCLGSNPTAGAVCGTADYVSCPSTLILNNFFDGAPDFKGFGLPITTDLTLVPCSENLTRTGPAGTPNVVAQFLVYNEFEQRFSASTSVRCFKETRLTDIDAPGNPAASIFSIFVQGTLTGQTRIRPVIGSELDVGHGLLGVAEEFVGVGFPFPLRGSDAFNLNYVGTNPGKSDVVVVPPPATLQ